MALAVGLSYGMHLQDEIQLMRDLDGIMCDGNKTFVYSIMPLSDFFYYSDTQPYGEPRDQNSLQIYETAESMVRNTSTPFPVIRFASYGHFLEETQWGFEGLVTRAWCLDALDSDSELINMSYAKMIDSFRSQARLKYNASAHTCKDIASFCDGGFTSNLARFLCPQTCGCNHSRSGLIGNTIAYGCNVDICRAAEDVFFRDVPCEDVSPFTVDSTPGWNRYFGNVLKHDQTKIWFSVAASQMPGPNLTAKMEIIRRSGCAFLRHFPASTDIGQVFRSAVCAGDRFFHGIAAFCPISCGCKNPTMSQLHLSGACPKSCQTV
jgi:hypothetical protein